MNNKSIKFEGNIYIDSKAIVHNKEPLSEKVINSSGSDEKGYWIKFEDGTMICRGVQKFEKVSMSKWGETYYFDTDSYQFPQPFLEAPDVFGISTNYDDSHNNYVFCGGFAQTTKTHTGFTRLTRPVIADSYLAFKWLAIGKWK